MKRKTNFDQYLEEQLKDEDFAERFKRAGDAWDVALETEFNKMIGQPLTDTKR